LELAIAILIKELIMTLIIIIIFNIYNTCLQGDQFTAFAHAFVLCMFNLVLTIKAHHLKRLKFKGRGSTFIALRVIPYVLGLSQQNGQPPAESIAQGTQLRSSSDGPGISENALVYQTLRFGFETMTS